MNNSGYRISVSLAVLAGALLTVLMILSCGGGRSQITQTTGTVTTNISDPPTCEAPKGPFLNVWVTITKVRAHISSDAGPNDSGWVDLVDQTSNPKQIDLLSLASKTCILTQLGSTTGLPPGNYQQIRLLLLNNTPGSGEATPSPNQCGASNAFFNCVFLASNGTPQTLQLTSEAQTGIKIPPGQIAGGGIKLMAGQSADLNIDFDSCASIVDEGGGQFGLKPTLHAGEVSLNTNSISGNVVVNGTTTPVPGAVVILEQPDLSGVDRKVRSTIAADGTFIFCPLPAGTYDVVVGAITTPAGVTTAYNATITLGVSLGTALKDIPLVPEPAANSQPASITGQVTTAGSSMGVAANVTLSPLQQATPTGGTALQVTIPAFTCPPMKACVPASSQPLNLTTVSGGGCPAGTDCATYTLSIPGSNPQVGTFNASGTNYNPPAPGNVNYTVEADASTCSPTSNTSGLLTVTAGGPPVTANLALTGCS